jgi:hypothetical protein
LIKKIIGLKKMEEKEEKSINNEKINESQVSTEEINEEKDLTTQDLNSSFIIEKKERKKNSCLYLTKYKNEINLKNKEYKFDENNSTLVIFENKKIHFIELNSIEDLTLEYE